MKITFNGIKFFLAFLAANSAFSASAQIYQAWVARYNNGVTNGANQAVKIVLDPAGNIYVTGFSQNANSNLGYATIEYGPNGNQLWAARFDSTNDPNAVPAGIVLDSSNNVIVTGNTVTVKYGTNGNQVWTSASNGTALAVDPGCNVYLTGRGTNFNTLKLSASGSNVWSATYVDVGPTLAQAILVDAASNVYVVGSDTWIYYGEGTNIWGSYARLAAVKYNATGGQIWRIGVRLPYCDYVPIAGGVLDNADNIYITANSKGLPYDSSKYASDGSVVWYAEIPATSGDYSLAYGIAYDQFGNAFVTGTCASGSSIGTYKIGTNGAYVWTNLYPPVPVAASVGTAIAVDQSNNVYVTGYSPGTNSTNDIVTIKYDNDGNQIWVQRYNGTGTGDDRANAIAVDANGNVYVTGYESTTAGGTEMVTIKYAPGASLQMQSNGTVLLQTGGNPGQTFNFQASTNLQAWQVLGSTNAGTNGTVQFLDTNAPLLPYRFYFANPQ